MNELVIEAGRGEREYWKDLWRYRELLYFLAWRDLLVRYKQTAVGVAWALVRPLSTMAILTVFARVANLPSAGVPQALLVFCGMLPWQFFSTAVSETGNSLVGNSNLIAKIYFPRLVVPASTVIVSLVDFGISAIFLVGLMIWYHFVPSAHVWVLPVFVLLTFAAAFGAGLWVAALMVEYRDFRHIIPFAMQFGLYISPVAYLTVLVPERWRLAYSLNPMVGVIDGFRWSLLGRENSLDWRRLTMCCVVTSILLVSGLWYFRKTERSFADVI